MLSFFSGFVLCDSTAAVIASTALSWSVVVLTMIGNAEAIVVAAAQRMGMFGFDHYRYYNQLPPTVRTGNKMFPNGAVDNWNIYDHGVNNAEGAVRSRRRRLAGWPPEGGRPSAQPRFSAP